jgi:hypothetical protein
MVTVALDLRVRVLTIVLMNRTRGSSAARLMDRSRRSSIFCWMAPDESRRVEIIAQRATPASTNYFLAFFNALGTWRGDLARLARRLQYYGRGRNCASMIDRPFHKPAGVSTWPL